MKQRVDNLLVTCGLCESRTEAQKMVLAGQVRVGPDQVVRKPSELFAPGTVFTVEQRSPYVSRGAAKLLAALDRFTPELEGTVALDIGASTGGFTDLLLQRGCRRVYAVDVGKGQLHYRLRRDSRVVCMEGVNARYLSAEQIPEPVDILTAEFYSRSITLNGKMIIYSF